MSDDVLSVENLDGGGVLRNFTSATISNDIIQPAEAAFELGDDGTWREINDFVKPGSRYRVSVNGQPRITGRVELLDAPVDASGGAVVRFTVRSKLSDAWYASANPKVRLKGVSIKDYLLQLYEPFGFTEEDFEFDAAVSRDLMTGKRKGDTRPPVELEPIREDQLRPNPPESVYMAADRVLRRHGLMHWDSPEGKIVVSSPNDEQAPLYSLRMMIGAAGRANNLLDAVRMQDWTEVASVVAVYGRAGGWDFSHSKVRSISGDDEVLLAGFYRPITVIADGLSQAMADRTAAREKTARSKRKDAWKLSADGWSFRNGAEKISYAIDTTCDVVASVAGGPAGAYYVHRVVLKRDANEGDTAELEVLRRGVWVL